MYMKWDHKNKFIELTLFELSFFLKIQNLAKLLWQIMAIGGGKPHFLQVDLIL